MARALDDGGRRLPGQALLPGGTGGTHPGGAAAAGDAPAPSAHYALGDLTIDYARAPGDSVAGRPVPAQRPSSIGP